MKGKRKGRLLEGAVVQLSGAYPEMCLHRLTEENVRFGRANKTDDVTVTTLLSLRDLKKAERIAGKCMCELTVLERVGILPKITAVKKRLVLLPILAVLVMISLLLQERSWFFAVEGNDRVPAQRILQILEESGVKPGVNIADMDMNELRNRVLGRLPELAFLTINTQGPSANIIVHEKTLKPVTDRDPSPANILAAKAGRITKVETVGGSAQVAAGDVVAAGDLLISGICNLDKTMLITRAEGEVLAETWNPVDGILPERYIRKHYTGKEKTGFCIVFGKKTINILKSSRIFYRDYDKITEKTEVCLPGGYALPVHIVKTVWREYLPVEETLSGETAQRILEAAAEAQIRGALSAGMILSSNLNQGHENGSYTMTGIFKCTEEIGMVSNIED